MNKFYDSMFFRLAVVGACLALEIGLTISVLDYFYTQFAWLETVLRILSLVIVLIIIRRSRHLSSDLMWILLIVTVPVVGTIIYLFLGANLVLGRGFRNIVRQSLKAHRYYQQDPAVLDELAAQDPQAAGKFRYLLKDGGFPTYRNTGMTYYPLGDKGFPRMLEDLRQAQRFIFMEYFIIDQGELWDAMLDILREKAAAGVDVRVLYDDVGSLGLLPQKYGEQLQAAGIKCMPFNRLSPIMTIFVNHRDHRKMLIIDGSIAYTGGINLADEYINAREKFGHWKDNVLRVTGEAVWSFTCMFLTTWCAVSTKDEDFEHYRGPVLSGEVDGFVAPYGETPLDNKLVGQNVYLNIINQATRYCYIYTPYLIIDTEMRNALMLAARRGVDVRLVTPGVPDKQIIWDITRSHYSQLILGGVHVLEYTPGFVHAKVFVSDDEVATVGTLNLDYRSLYLHFENGVLMYDTRAVNDVYEDFQHTFPQCHEMTVEESRKGPLRELLLCATRVVAPLL